MGENDPCRTRLSKSSLWGFSKNRWIASLRTWHFWPFRIFLPPLHHHVCLVTDSNENVRRRFWIKYSELPLKTHKQRHSLALSILSKPHNTNRISGKECFLEQLGKLSENNESYRFSFLWGFHMYTEVNSTAQIWISSVTDHRCSFSQCRLLCPRLVSALGLKVDLRKASCLVHRPVLSSRLHDEVFTKIYGATVQASFSCS